MPARAMASTGSSSLTNDPQLIDARGLKCPLPVLKMEKRLAAMQPGEQLTILATDPMAKIDIPLHCRQHGHACIVESVDEALRFLVTKG